MTETDGRVNILRLTRPAFEALARSVDQSDNDTQGLVCDIRSIGNERLEFGHVLRRDRCRRRDDQGH